MPYQFPADVDALLRQQIGTGYYDSEDDVLRKALQALCLQDQEVAAIQEGIDDMQAGRVRSFREFDREFRQRKGIPQSP